MWLEFRKLTENPLLHLDFLLIIKLSYRMIQSINRTIFLFCINYHLIYLSSTYSQNASNAVWRTNYNCNSIFVVNLLPELGVTLAAVFTVLIPHRKNHYFLEIKIKSDWGQIKYEAVKHRINSKFLFYSIYYNILFLRIWAKVVLLIFEKYNMRSMRWKCVWTYVVTLLFHGLRNGFFA